MRTSNMSRVEVILFDLGGVLMDFSGLKRLAALTGEEDGPELRARWVASQWPQAFERGSCSAHEFGAGVVRDWDLDMTPSEFVQEFTSWPAGPFEGSLDLLRSLHGVVPMGCASNTNPAHWDQHLTRWGVVQYFDWTFVSHELGTLKPDPDFYHQVIAGVGRPPEQLLFLDDIGENVLAAREIGMQAHQTGGIGEVKAIVARYFSR